MRKNLDYQKINGLFVFCRKCRSDINGNSKSANGCNHPIESQAYKAIIRIPTQAMNAKQRF